MKVKQGLISLFFIGVLLPMLGVIVTHQYFSDTHWYQPAFHSTIEGIGACAALMLATLLFLLREHGSYKSPYIFTACAFIAMGVLQIFHASSKLNDTFVFLSCLTTLVGGFMFLLICLPKKAVPLTIRKLLPYVVLFGAVIIGVYFNIFPETLPPMLDDDEFTDIAKMMSIVGGVMFIFASIGFARLYSRRENLDDILLAHFCMFFGIAGLQFEISKPWNADWWYWHFLKLVSYIIVLLFIFMVSKWARAKITETNKSLEEKVSEVKKANNEIKRFAQVVSHDLKNPMTNIMGMAEILLDYHGDDLNNEQKVFFASIIRNVTIMNALLNGLSEVVMIGRTKEVKENIDVKKLLEDIIDENMSVIIEKRAEVILPENIAEVYFTKIQLYQVFSNLIKNAIKFSRKGVPPKIWVGFEEKENKFLFSVTDNGIGIDRENITSVFQIFSRVKEVDVEGTGVGLYIVRKIIEDNGGRIVLQSKKNVGSKFTFTILKKESVKKSFLDKSDAVVETMSTKV